MVLLACKTEQPVWARTAKWSEQEACFVRVAQVWLAVNHNTSDTSGEWIWCSKRIVLHVKVRLAFVNQIYVFHEAMNGCKSLKIHNRLTSKM